MEQKITVGEGKYQVNITVPRGFEIDIENSTITNIKYKPKLDMKTVIEALQDEGTDNATYLARNGDLTLCVSTIDWEDKHIARVVAYAALSDIAKYYNGDWKPNWDDESFKYYIKYDTTNKEYVVTYVRTQNEGAIYFKDGNDAEEVIAMPSFRKILDTLYK